ncbi:MAG: lipoyl(octanoyl) transferase LipB [Phycisphaeraceae bacterium]|nr:lipoyl(octanoyl) transferase LipB [Phycisphaeraceae bacterium]
MNDSTLQSLGPSGPNPISMGGAGSDVEWSWLGRMAYPAARSLQQSVHQRVVDEAGSMRILMLEHDPVITVSRRAGASGHVLADASTLESLGIEVCPTDRGGDVTYHGPGQLVAYPILKLRRLGMGLGEYVRWLERVIIEWLGELGVKARCDPSATGVWVDVDPGRGDDTSARPVKGGYVARSPAKIAAIGVRYSRGVTLHGLALNLSPRMSHFETIVPCGLAGRPVTHLRALLGDATPGVEEAARSLGELMCRRLVAMRKREG